MNKNLNNFKARLMSLGVALCISLSAVGISFADSARVVTLGADITDKQKDIILEYFGVNENEVVVLEVNNQEERQYLEGIASESQIGKKTYSCAYVEPTHPGDGLNIKTANITWVNASMVATTMSTAGMTDANVVIAANFPVSGTGALTGIMKAFEDATGEKLDEEKKELATEELVTTGELGADENIGQEVATGIVNDIKTEIIKEGTTDTNQISEVINNVTNNYNIDLSVDQNEQIQSLMEKIAAQDYNYDEMKAVLEDVKDTVDQKLDELGIEIDTSFFDGVKGFFVGIGDFFTGLFEQSSDLGILESTNDELLGEDAVVDVTDLEALNIPSEEEVEGFFTKIWNSVTDFMNDTLDFIGSIFNLGDENVDEYPSEDSQNEEVQNLEDNTITHENVDTNS